jgi:hypothetical protein
VKKYVEINFYNVLTKILEDLGSQIRKKISFVTEIREWEMGRNLLLMIDKLISGGRWRYNGNKY